MAQDIGNEEKGILDSEDITMMLGNVGKIMSFFWDSSK
jgi:hypothetical protein